MYSIDFPYVLKSRFHFNILRNEYKWAFSDTWNGTVFQIELCFEMEDWRSQEIAMFLHF